MDIRGSQCILRNKHIRTHTHLQQKAEQPRCDFQFSCRHSSNILVPCSSSLSVYPYPLSVPSSRAWGNLLICPPFLLARLYFFIRPSGGCHSPRGCQSTLILIRTRVLSGVNGSQQLSTGFSQSRPDSSITLLHACNANVHACTHTLAHFSSNNDGMQKKKKQTRTLTVLDRSAVERIMAHSRRFAAKSLGYERLSI